MATPGFFSIFIFISGGDQKLLFPSYSPLQNSLLGRISIPGEMAVLRTPHQ
jgi:hypothetical protein